MVVMSMVEWAQILGLPYSTLWRWQSFVQDVVGSPPYSAEQVLIILRAGLESRKRGRGEVLKSVGKVEKAIKIAKGMIT